MPESSRDIAFFSERPLLAARLLNGGLIALLCLSTLLMLLHFDRSFIIGHDESVYSTKARQWLTGQPADQFEIYRPIGMPVATWFLLRYSDSEGWLRLFGIFFGMLLPASVFFLFRQMCNLWVSLAIALVASTSYLFFEQAPRLLDDVPSTALLLFAMALLYAHFKSGGMRPSIYLAAPIAASAFYLRYGAATSLLVIGIFSYLLLLPKYLQFERQHFIKIGQTALVGIFLLMPHFIYSIATTGSLFGVLQLAGKAAHRVYLGEGLVTYLDLLPTGIGGWVLGVSAIVGICVLIFFILTPMREKYLGLTWAGCIGLASFFLTGLLVHAEPRYVLFPMILLSGTGIAGVFYLVGRWSREAATALLISLYIVTGYFGIRHFQELTTFFKAEVASLPNNNYKQALLAIRADAGDTPCGIWTPLDGPRASWYAHCEIFRLRDRAQFMADVDTHEHHALYMISASRVRNAQLSTTTLQNYGLSAFPLYSILDVPNYGDLTVYRISKP